MTIHKTEAHKHGKAINRAEYRAQEDRAQKAKKPVQVKQEGQAKKIKKIIKQQYGI